MIKPSLDHIFDTVLSCFGISEDEYNNEKHTRSLKAITVRQAMCYLGQNYGYSQTIIGKYLGIDHSTVCYNKKVAQDLCDTENEYASNMMRALNHLDSIIKVHKEYSIKGFVARDRDGFLNFYAYEKPIKGSGMWFTNTVSYPLPEEAYPLITYDCEPYACTMTLKLK